MFIIKHIIKTFAVICIYFVFMFYNRQWYSTQLFINMKTAAIILFDNSRTELVEFIWNMINVL